MSICIWCWSGIFRKLACAFLLLAIMSVRGALLMAQQGQIYWADQVEYQYNNYHEKYFSGQEVLGPPNAFPPGHLNKQAFRLKTQNSYGKLVVGLKHPQPIQHLVIVENNDPGRLVKIKLKDTEGEYHLIYQNKAEQLKQDFRTFVVSMPETPYKVESIELNINCIQSPGIYQVDAIGVLNNEDFTIIEQQLKGANFNIQQEFTFSEQKEMLGEAINSKFTEIKPLVNHDGSALYFSRMFSPENVGGKKDPQDIYFSRLLNGNWTEAYNIGLPLNDELANGICTITPDGKAALLINAYEKHGKIKEGVSISYKSATGWSKPVKVDIDGFKNKSQYQDYYLSPDGKVIIMAIENGKSQGEQDLYVSKKIGQNHFSKPQNLGPVINTEEADFAPFIAFDNKTLFFASEGHGGYGQSDIYKSVRLDDTWLNWTEPKNMGPSINSSSWDAYFSIPATNDYAYFVSSEESRNGRENIYRIPLYNKDKPKTTEELVTFTGKVINAKTNVPVFADLLLKDESNHTPYRSVSDKTTGKYTVFIPPQKNMVFTVKAPGFISYQEKIDMEDVRRGEYVEKIIKLKPIEKGEVITLKNLYFERGEPNILDKSMLTLDKLLQLMMENASLEIELAGHTDGVGSRSSNMALSVDRVERIKSYLVQFGIDDRRILTVGYGGKFPVAPVNTEENRAKNRRVEVKILKIDG